MLPRFSRPAYLAISAGHQRRRDCHGSHAGRVQQKYSTQALREGPFFPQNPARLPRSRPHGGASRGQLRNNNNGCTESPIRAQTGNRSGSESRPARASQSPAAGLLPGGRPVLQHHDVRGDGLSVITFYHRPDLATLPVTMQHIGVMLWVFPAALLMQRVGRSIGFRVGSLFGMAGAIIMCLGLYTANFLVMCAGGLDPRLRRGLPADVPLRRGRTGADPLPRQGDFVGYRRRRRRRRDRPQPGARDARSDDAALSRDLCGDSRPARHRLHDHVLHQLPLGRDPPRPPARPRSPHRRGRCGRSPASRASSRPSSPACWRSARCPSS